MCLFQNMENFRGFFACDVCGPAKGILRFKQRDHPFAFDMGDEKLMPGAGYRGVSQPSVLPVGVVLQIVQADQEDMAEIHPFDAVDR